MEEQEKLEKEVVKVVYRNSDFSKWEIEEFISKLKECGYKITEAE